MGALALNVQKYGSSRFKRSKAWELSLYMLKGVGFFALHAQEWELSRFSLFAGPEFQGKNQPSKNTG